MKFFAIRHEGAPDGLIRRHGAEFEYLNRSGHWVERPELLKKVREWNVDPVDEAEAAAIAMRLGASSLTR
jgi:hypothetical protein